MEEKLYTITLDNGTVIDDLRLNGNNFVSQEEIKPEIFNGHLRTVIFSDGETTETHHNMALVQITRMSDGWYFVLRDVTEKEIEESRMRSDIDYLGMMMDITL